MDSANIGSGLALPSGVRLNNRVAKAAMSENLATSQGQPTEQLVRLYRHFGRCGAGLLITGNVIVDPGGRTEPHNVVVTPQRTDSEDRAVLRHWADAAKAEGSKVFVQLNHAGRQTPRMVNWSPVAPSAVGLRKSSMFSVPRALERSQIRLLVQRFAAAAAILADAGFDGVQIHAAHGYLVSQFLSPLTNRRTDEYGGDLAGRMKFLCEVVRAVRRETGRGFGIAVKLNSADFQRGGFDHDDALHVARALEGEGIDLLEVSGGNYETPAMIGVQRASTAAREAYFLEYAEQLREEVSLPLMVTGGFRTRSAMNDALASGATDVIGIARPFAVVPELAGELVTGSAVEAPDFRPGIGIRLVDDVLQLVWFQRQMERWSLGLDADPVLGSWGVLARHLAYMASTVLGAATVNRPGPLVAEAVGRA